jgi:HEAT repeat protein
MIAFVLAALLLAAAEPSPPAPAPAALCRDLTAAELEQRVETLLHSIDAPILPEEWQALGSRAVALLQRIASDRGALPTRRAQALWGLAHLAGPAAAPALNRLAGREGEPLAVRLAAVRALGAVTSPGQVEAVLAPILERALDARVRAGAAEQLVRRTSGAACPLVKARAAAEGPTGRALLAPAVEGCQTP